MIVLRGQVQSRRANTSIYYEYAGVFSEDYCGLTAENISYLQSPLNIRQILLQEIAWSSSWALPGPEFCCDYPSHSYHYLFTGVAGDEIFEHRYIDSGQSITMSMMLPAQTPKVLFMAELEPVDVFQNPKQFLHDLQIPQMSTLV